MITEVRWLQIFSWSCQLPKELLYSTYVCYGVEKTVDMLVYLKFQAGRFNSLEVFACASTSQHVKLLTIFVLLSLYFWYLELKDTIVQPITYRINLFQVRSLSYFWFCNWIEMKRFLRQIWSHWDGWTRVKIFIFIFIIFFIFLVEILKR